METIGHNAAPRLRSFFDRIERLNTEEDAIKADKREVFAEAKAVGFHPATMRRCIALGKMDPEKRTEQEDMTDLYMRAWKGEGEKGSGGRRAPAHEGTTEAAPEAETPDEVAPELLRQADEEGTQACLDGVAFQRNPYGDDKFDQANAWADGWRRAHTLDRAPSPDAATAPDADPEKGKDIDTGLAVPEGGFIDDNGDVADADGEIVGNYIEASAKALGVATERITLIVADDGLSATVEVDEEYTPEVRGGDSAEADEPTAEAGEEQSGSPPRTSNTGTPRGPVGDDGEDLLDIPPFLRAGTPENDAARGKDSEDAAE